MYDFFIDRIMIPIYRYVLKPMKLIIYFLWLFIKYIFVAITGNTILILIMIILLSNTDFTCIREDIYSTIQFMIYGLLVGATLICFLYNFFNLFSFYNRDDIIDKEPEFVKNIGDVIFCTYVKILKDVKSRDGKQLDIKQKKKEKEKEKEQVRLNTIHSRSEILDI